MNSGTLATDACTSFGMAGVFHLHIAHNSYKRFSELFKQIPWKEWYKVLPIPALSPNDVKINVAKFLTLLITFETFTAFCAVMITSVEIGNVSTKA